LLLELRLHLGRHVLPIPGELERPVGVSVECPEREAAAVPELQVHAAAGRVTPHDHLVPVARHLPVALPSLTGAGQGIPIDIVHSFVIVSSRFSNSRDSAVHAAAWAGVTPSGSFGGWAGSLAARSHGFASGAANFSACFVRKPSSTSSS